MGLVKGDVGRKKLKKHGGVRLHVGGLGESVGRDDLLKIFSSMSSVEACSKSTEDLAYESREEPRVNSNGDGEFSNSNQNDGGMKQRDHSCSAVVLRLRQSMWIEPFCTS
ncbi:unnamed protein product [Brassica rapa subsp. narinosa]